MKINLQEKLDLEKKKDMEVLDSVKEVKLLLAGAESEDSRILRNLSENSELNRVEKITQTALEIEKIESQYTGNIFTISQIKKLAVEYRLRFLSTRFFTGKFDVEVAAKIKEFGRDNNIALNEYQLKNNFFVLAPKEQFELKEKKYIDPKPVDPVLFYKIDDTHYRMIHKWGSDFTIMRYIEGFKWKNLNTYLLYTIFARLPIFAFLVGLLYDITFLEPTIANIFFITFVITAPTVLLVIFRNWYRMSDSDWDGIEGFFSETNWNSAENITR